MNRSYVNVQTLSVPQVPPGLVYRFVKETPEGLNLWEALCLWRTHYQEKQKAETRLKRLKKPTKTQKEATTEFHKARNRLKRSYKAALAAFTQAIQSEFILPNHAAELAAIATELDIEFEAPKPGDQLSLRLNA